MLDMNFDIIIFIYFQEFKGKLISFFIFHEQNNLIGAHWLTNSTRYFLPIHRIITENSDVINMLVRVISRV